MKYPLKYLIILCFLIFQIKSSAQSTVAASGGNASGSGGTVSYTIGQIAYTSNSYASGSIAQGVQQPYEISVVTGIENQSISLTWSVYPNPVNYDLTLKIDNNVIENFSFKLLDIKGNLFMDEKIKDGETIISMGSMIPGIYFLQVYDSRKIIKTFKIIKN